MPSSFHIFRADPIKKVGEPILIVAIIRPVGVEVVRVEWNLLVRSHEDRLSFCHSDAFRHDPPEIVDIRNPPAALTDKDLIRDATGLAMSKLMEHQVDVHNGAEDAEILREVDFIPSNENLIRNWWIHSAGRPEIERIKNDTMCPELNGFLRNLIATGGIN